MKKNPNRIMCFSLNDFDCNTDDSYIKKKEINSKTIDAEDQQLDIAYQRSSCLEGVKGFPPQVNSSNNMFTPSTRHDLDILIKNCINTFGVDCNLNWIDVTGVTNFRGLFLHSSFKGDISNWIIADGADCSYMFAFSEFDNLDNLPKSLRDELTNPSKNISTKGIFYGCKGEKYFDKNIAKK